MTGNRTTLDELRIDRDRAPRRSVAPALTSVIVAVVVLGLLGIWWHNAHGNAVAVHTVAVRESVSSDGGDRTLLNASGYVTARRAATVSSKVTAKVVEVHVEEGMKVDEGQVLARLDSSNVERTLKFAEAQLEAARKSLGETQANLDQANSELKRRKEAGNGVSILELEKAEALAKSLDARLKQQQAQVEVADSELAMRKQDLDDTIIRAPFTGIVTSKDSQPGEMISPISAGGGFTRTGICTIVDMSSLEIEVDVSESYINRVERGQPVFATLDAYPNWRVPAKVIAIIPTADRQKATVKVRVGFEKLDPRILPDMSVKVAFQSTDEPKSGATNHRLSAPKSAVRSVDGKDVVWVVRDGKLERRAVTVGGVMGDDATITAGVTAGEKVVVEGPADKLAEGVRVTEVDR
jgi:HlyD family secretion protein